MLKPTLLCSVPACRLEFSKEDATFPSEPIYSNLEKSEQLLSGLIRKKKDMLL